MRAAVAVQGCAAIGVQQVDVHVPPKSLSSPGEREEGEGWRVGGVRPSVSSKLMFTFHQRVFRQGCVGGVEGEGEA